VELLTFTESLHSGDITQKWVMSPLFTGLRIVHPEIWQYQMQEN